MTQSRPEQDPKNFSPRFEEKLQKEERWKHRRTRTRKKGCLFEDCSTLVHRANKFDLCVNHLLLIWQHVEGESFSRHDIWVAEDALTSPVAAASDLTPDETELRAAAKRERARRVATQDGHLYVLDTKSGHIKIGWTANLPKRMAQYPPTFEHIIDIPGTRADERDVHRSLKHARALGREWYYVTPEVVRQINEWIAKSNIRSQQSATDSNEAEANQRAQRREQGLPPLPWEVPLEWPAMRPKFQPAEHHITEVPGSPPAPRPRTGGRRIA